MYKEVKIICMEVILQFMEDKLQFMEVKMVCQEADHSFMEVITLPCGTHRNTHFDKTYRKIFHGTCNMFHDITWKSEDVP